MIVSVHLARVGVLPAVTALRHPPGPRRVPGLRWAVAAAPLVIGHVPPRPLPGRVGLVSAWDDDDALDVFLATHPWARHVAGGFEVRLEVLRSSGTWSALPELEGGEGSGEPGDPVGVLTLGRLKLGRSPAFFRASARAERPLLRHPALLASVGLARPPFLSTFSLWRSTSGMEQYAYAPGHGHASASAEHHARAFHHEAIFVRLRPYRSRGAWNGVEPLAGVRLPSAR